MCANCNVFLKNKNYYSLANCKCFCNLWSHYAQLKTYFIFGIFHVPSPIKLSHKCMASIFNYRLLFTLCATVWPCNLNFNIQLMVRFHFFIKLYCSHLYGIYSLDRQLFTLCAIICPFKIMQVYLSVIPLFFIHFLMWPPKVSINDVCFESKGPTIQV